MFSAQYTRDMRFFDISQSPLVNPAGFCVVDNFS